MLDISPANTLRFLASSERDRVFRDEAAAISHHIRAEIDKRADFFLNNELVLKTLGALVSKKVLSQEDAYKLYSYCLKHVRDETIASVLTGMPGQVLIGKTFGGGKKSMIISAALNAIMKPYLSGKAEPPPAGNGFPGLGELIGDRLKKGNHGVVKVDWGNGKTS